MTEESKVLREDIDKATIRMMYCVADICNGVACDDLRLIDRATEELKETICRFERLINQQERSTNYES